MTVFNSAFTIFDSYLDVTWVTFTIFDFVTRVTFTIFVCGLAHVYLCLAVFYAYVDHGLVLTRRAYIYVSCVVCISTKPNRRCTGPRTADTPTPRRLHRAVRDRPPAWLTASPGGTCAHMGRRTHTCTRA
nr:MAG TPA: hypothetical protein [Caudoviricetes sp.]